jgi:dihydroxy-acid dehydratase
MKRRLRSQDWFGKQDKDGFIHRSWLKNQGYPDDMFDGRPVIGICNTWSELTPCNGHFREIAEFVKRGVLEGRRVPARVSRDVARRDAAQADRDVVPQPRQHGCRRIHSRQSHGRRRAAHGMRQDHARRCSWVPRAAICRPSAFPAGPCCQAASVASRSVPGTGVWQMSEDVRAGKMSQEEFTAAESCMHRSKGHCMTMGTASTMASMVEALGVSLPGNAAIPAVDSRRYRMAQLSGRRIVEMVREDLVLSKILTRQAFENAIMANAAIGGSTNSVVHLLAIAGRLGVKLELEDWDKHGSTLPCLVNLQPSGQYLMEDFYYAGGLPAVLKEISSVLNRDAMTANGKTMGENIANAPCWNREVIKAFDDPFKANAGIAILRGNLAPNGAVIKPSAATPKLLKHRGPAVVFETIEDFKARIDDESLEIDENCIMVLKGCGPKGYPGMAEVGNMALPPKILRKGITDMVRISDARMSGTAYGTVVLHVAPESAAGGPLALVKTGDVIELDVPAPQAAPRRERCEARQAPRGVGGAGAAEARLLQALCRARAAGRQGRGPGFPGRRQRHHVTRDSH